MGEHQEDLGDEEAVEAAEGDEVGDDSLAGEVAAELAGGEGAPGHGLRDDGGEDAEGHEDEPGAVAAGGGGQACHRANCDGHESCRGNIIFMRSVLNVFSTDFLFQDIMK